MNRLAGLVTLFIFVTFIAGVLHQARSADASLYLAGQRASEAELLLLEKQQINAIQFAGKFWSGLFVGNFGLTNGNLPIIEILIPAAKLTLILASSAAFLSLIYGIGLLTLCLKKPSMVQIVEKINFVILGVPVFLIGLLLIWVFSLYFPLFNPGGTNGYFWWFLPAISLALRAGPRLFIAAAEFYKRETKKPYQRTMSAMGYTKRRKYWPYTLKNLSLPVLSFWLVDFASYLAGAAVVETVFTLPGLGSLLLSGLFSYDIQLILSVLVIIAVFLFFIGLLQDLLQRQHEQTQS
jgi:peptide/nickel transport system permease protein